MHFRSKSVNIITRYANISSKTTTLRAQISENFIIYHVSGNAAVLRAHISVLGSSAMTIQLDPGLSQLNTLNFDILTAKNSTKQHKTAHFEQSSHLKTAQNSSNCINIHI